MTWFKGAAVAAVAVVAFVAGALVAVGVGTFPGSTVVGVRGSGEYGFTVRHLDGSAVHTPTRSESLAECGEYAVRVERAVCRYAVGAQVRRYTDLKRTIRYMRAQ